MLFASLAVAVVSGRADWKLVIQNQMKSAETETNVLVRKLAARGVRDDLGTETSMLFLLGAREQIILNHEQKTFVRHPIHDASSNAIPAPAFAAPERTTLNNIPADAHRWASGSNAGCLWTAAATNFFRGVKLLPRPAGELKHDLGVGTLVTSNTMVFCTEQPIMAEGNSGNTNTQSTMTFRSLLLSIEETTFSQSEFEIPKEYKDVTGHPVQSPKIDPAMFGSRAAGQNNYQGMKKLYRKGQMVIGAPPGKPANSVAPRNPETP